MYGEIVSIAVCSRRLQFESGPQQHTFYACREHKRILELGNVICFFALNSELIVGVSPDDEVGCDFCREGGREGGGSESD